MELDTKQKVLIAIYTEYQKDLPNMEKNITPQNLGLDNDVLKMALVKLDNENLINDVKLVYGGNSEIPLIAILDHAKISRYGIEYVEQKLQIDKTLSNKDKVKKVGEVAANWGWEQIKDVIAKTLAEIAKP